MDIADRSPWYVDEGSSAHFSSAEEAVEGLLGLLLLDLGGKGSRGAGESVMCGAIAAREKETSSRVRDGAADTEEDASSGRKIGAGSTWVRNFVQSSLCDARSINQSGTEGKWRIIWVLMPKADPKDQSRESG